MNKLKGTAALLGIVALAAAALFAADKKTEPKPGLFTDEVLARGKGFEVKSSELDEAFIALKSSLAARGQNVPEEQRATVESELLERLVINKVLLNKATDTDRAQAKETSQKLISDAKERFPTEEVFNKQLRAAGLTRQQFEARVLEQSICEKVVERELTATIKVADEEIETYYNENPQHFEEPESVRASHILLSTRDPQTEEPLPAEKKKEREAEIRKLRDRAVEGEDFAKLAREHSEDPGSKERGGEYTFPRGQMVKEFETAAFSLKPDQISDVVETQFGYHIIKLHERIPARKIPLEEVADDLRQGLTQRELQQQLPDYLEKLKEEFEVEILARK